MSTAGVQTLNELGLTERTKMMCFDTTASNTGCYSGARALIETKLGSKLLHLARRHHMHEVILSDFFKHCLCCSSGTEIGLFKRINSNWSIMNK